MLNLTKEEKLVLVFFITCFIIGSGVNYYKKSNPFHRESSALVPISFGASSGARPININTADFTELISLKGVGGMTAIRIIDYRSENGPFYSKEDIMKVKGIGNSKFSGLKERITIE